MFVDEVRARQLVVTRGGHNARQGDIHVAIGEQADESRRDRRIARDRPGGDMAVGVHLDQGWLARGECGQRRHVLGRPVGEMGRGAQRERLRVFQGALGRLDGDPLDARCVGWRARHPRSDPSEHRLVARSPRRQPQAAAVRQPRRGLAQQQALCGHQARHPPSARVLHDRLVIAGRVEAQQRQGEPVLAPRLAVTRPGIATGPRQDRLDVAFERHRSTFARPERRQTGPGHRRHPAQQAEDHPSHPTAPTITEDDAIPFPPVKLNRSSAENPTLLQQLSYPRLFHRALHHTLAL